MVIEDVGNRKSAAVPKGGRARTNFSWPRHMEIICVKSPKSNAAAVAVWSRTWLAQSSASEGSPEGPRDPFRGHRGHRRGLPAASMLGNDRAPNQWSWAHFNGARPILDPD